MKTMVSVLLLGLLVGFSSCELLSGNEPQTELEKLPPITQEGKNTFGCLVNGKALVAPTTMDITAIYQQGNLQLGGGVEENDVDKDITIFLGDPLVIGTEYSLVDHSMYRDKNSLTTCRYEFEDTFSGSIIFSKIDRTNYIISGTFEFSTVTIGCDTVRITDGRFDIQYIP
jgi:hypothetical protein